MIYKIKVGQKYTRCNNLFALSGPLVGTTVQVTALSRDDAVTGETVVTFAFLNGEKFEFGHLFCSDFVQDYKFVVSPNQIWKELNET
jgi:hypothetical protein